MTTRPHEVRGEMLSIEEFERMPDDEMRSELVGGHVVREPPAGFEHGRLHIRLCARVEAFVSEHKLGVVLGAETGFILEEDPPTVRAPDCAFVAADRAPDEDVTGFAPFAPDLAVEIVSPSNSFAEVQAKVHDYLDAGTRLVWVADPRDRKVTVYRSRGDVRILSETDTLDGADVLPGFQLPVADVFK